jgi:hypothetical protein
LFVYRSLVGDPLITSKTLSAFTFWLLEQGQYIKALGDMLMLIKLFQSQSSNWLLMAEHLDDPPTWDRFVPSHNLNSERSNFDKIVISTAGNSIKIKVYKQLLKCGSSAYEYEWDTDEEAIISHAIQVAEDLKVDLQFDSPARKTA